MNKVVLVGRLVKDPDLKFTANKGTAVSRFTLAVNRPFKKDETDFINCIAFGKPGELIAQHLTKGRQIAVSGSILTGSYEAKDGTKRYTTDVNVDSFDFIGNSNSGTQQPNNSFGEPGFGDMTQVYDGDIPFK